MADSNFATTYLAGGEEFATTKRRGRQRKLPPGPGHEKKTEASRYLALDCFDHLTQIEAEVYADLSIPVKSKDRTIFVKFLKHNLERFPERPAKIILDCITRAHELKNLEILGFTEFPALGKTAPKAGEEVDADDTFKKMEWPMSKNRVQNLIGGLLKTRRAELDKDGGMDRLEKLIDRELRRVALDQPCLLLNDWQGLTKEEIAPIVHCGKALDEFVNQEAKKGKYSMEELVAYSRMRLDPKSPEGHLGDRFKEKGFGKFHLDARWTAGYFLDVKGNRVERGWFEGTKEGGLRNIRFPRLRISLG